ncbi:hypothetical protein [Bradyrhizobium lablabi]|uniref:hypothetical protein n=1 Tax=Bradyrhizobium lablabi TaxID=722472 RepID=UPI0012AC4EBA|nr:hypothetical protein [Bradyrhizobium lablabi]
MPTFPDHALGLRGILVLDLGDGISGFAKSNQHSLGEMNTFFVTFRDLVPRRTVSRTGMINESGFDGACYDDKGVFWHPGLPLLYPKHITLLTGTVAQRHHAQASQSSAPKPAVADFVTSRSSSRGFLGAIEKDGDYGSSAVLMSPRDQPC